ncbi:hypothetical protein HX096_12085 [Empedobacter falsenii]|uniref:hypothetical protein n=1 Tax=Empedobacter falsenii TaxID=343874 RepID=UPI0025766AFB|nr:hypothetical protein [Empedobacter falsenii]MDM1548592.1 hypothetical protein [Empedobacter falsenii]
MKELYLNNQLCDLNQSDPIQYNFQVNDIGDVESRQTTFTNTISLPRTKTNTMILEGLGLVGDTSRLPCQKINASLFEDTIPVIYNGWAVISSTDENYNLNLYSGIVDLFKSIENKNIGTDLDLSDTTHDKDLLTIFNSFSNEKYRYIIADYNGKSHLTIRGNSYVNIDYLVPSIRCKYLLDKIQETFGFEFNGSVFSSPKYLNWWMTYPKPSPKYEDDEEISPKDVGDATLSNFNIDNSTGDYSDESEIELIFNTTSVIEGEWVEFKKFKVLNSGTYRITYNGDAEADYQYEDNWTERKHFNYYQLPIDIYINNKSISRSLFLDRKEKTVTFSVQSGDEVSFHYNIIDRSNEYSNWVLYYFKIFNLSIKITQITSGKIDFGEALIDFSIKDFFKEFLWQFGLTPIVKGNNKVLFLTTDERINAEIINWSDKYNGRNNEEYLYGNYAQRNWFKYKYNDENSAYNDGYLKVNNQNLDDERDVIQSKIYTPEKDKEDFQINSNQTILSNTYMIWQKEIQEKNDENGNQTTEIKYKDLSNRYYFTRSIDNNNEIGLASEILNDFGIFESFSQEDYSDLSFSEIVKNEYLSLDSLINNSRKHFIKLKNLTPVDIQNLRFDVVYYFEQEQQYYILNKLPYQNTKENIGEFIRVIR